MGGFYKCRRFAMVVFVLVGYGHLSHSAASEAPSVARRLSAIEVIIEERGLVVTLSGDGQLKPPAVREAEDWPPRLVVDLPGVIPGVPGVTTIGVGPVEDIRVVAHSLDPLVTRVVFELRRTTTFEVAESDDRSGRLLTFVFPLKAPPDQRLQEDLGQLDQGELAAPSEGRSGAPARLARAMSHKATGRSVPRWPGRRHGAQPAVLIASPTQGAPRRYTGDPVSMDFQDAGLRAVLRTFAEISGLNIVIDPRVDGTVDVALTDVPWDQALDLILRANRLGYVVDGTVVRIAPLGVLADEQMQRRQLAEEQALSGEIVVLTRTLSYSRAAAMADLIAQTVLSARGQVQTDERTNTLIISDLQSRLSAAGDLLDTLDRAEPQVEIEARIVQAGHDFARAIGVQWGLTGRVAPDLGNTTPLTFPNRGGISGRVGTQGAEASGGDARARDTENVGTAVNLPAAAASSAVGVTMGTVDGSLNLDVVLSAAEGDGEIRLLSHPRVTTQNNVAAEIVQGDQIPIQTVSNNTVTVQFEDAALSLRVTPQITAEDTVIMQIEIDNDFADFGRAINGVSPIVTQRAATTVQVANGDTTVIGGIFESERTSSHNRVPGLHRIPLLGWLFRSQSERESTEELLIFLTPKIVR